MVTAAGARDDGWMAYTTRTRAEMARALARRDARGLTYDELSAETGIPVSTLSYWQRKLRDEAEAPAFVELELEDDAADAGEGDGAIEITSPGGYRVRFDSGVASEELRRVLEALPC